MKRIIILLFLVILAVSCTRIKVVGANFPSLFAEQVGNFDIAYGEKSYQKLDVYYPKNGKVKNPVIVFFYGGRWQYGSKNDYRFVADAFTERGYVVVLADYVKYPEGKYPQFVKDGADTIKWTRENVWKYNGDINRIYVMGHSAGAYIGAMITADKDFAVQKYIKGFAGLAGPYEMRITEEYKAEFDPIFDNPKSYDLICISCSVSGKQPPMILLRGDDDDRVNESHAAALQKAVKAKGGKVEIKHYPNIDHVGIVAALSQVRRDRAPVADDVDAFFRSIAR